MTRKRITRILAGLLSAASLLGGIAVWAAPGRLQEQTAVQRILFRVPSDCGDIFLSSAAREQHIPHDGTYAILEAPPGDYTLRCGEQSAALRIGATGPEVLGGCAAWDGEVLHMGQYGTLELVCSLRPGQQETICIRTANDTFHRSAAYDPALGIEAPVHRLTLPAGAVTVSWSGRSQSLTIRPGETQRVNIE